MPHGSSGGQTPLTSSKTGGNSPVKEDKPLLMGQVPVLSYGLNLLLDPLKPLG